MDDEACDQLLDEARARRTKKKRAVAANIKAHVLACGEEAVEAGGQIETFLRIIGLGKSRFYRWQSRFKAGGGLEDRKAIVKNCWWRLGEREKANVNRTTKQYPEIASQWVIGKLAGVSASSVGKIWKENGRGIQEVPARIEKRSWGSSEWQRVHACWSLDTMYAHLMNVTLYLFVLVEEYSRLILGWKLCSAKTADNAWDLVSRTMVTIGQKPLILKHDNGPEFIGAGLQVPLTGAGVLSLPSPAYYAPFNGRCERTIKEVRRFTQPVEERYGSLVYDLTGAIRRGSRVINDVLPRRIFQGRTSREVYQEGLEYTHEEEVLLIKRMVETQKRLEVEHERKRRYYDERRQAIIETVSSLNLCEVKYGQKSQAVFSPGSPE